MVKRVKRYLSETHPHLLEEWDYVKNGNLRPEDVTFGTNEKVWWRCKRKNHSWRAIVKNRTRRNGNGCPVCAGKLITECNNLEKLKPLLALDWDYTLNSTTPKKVGPGSSKKAWWLCHICNYSWEAAINSRSSGCGCPACSGRVATKENNFAIKFPSLLKEWDYNKNTINPHEVKAGSKKKVWWVCNKCEYSWETPVASRSNGKGCPACSGKVVTKKNNVESNSPNILCEWDYDRNRGRPSEYTNKSVVKVWWLCRVCGYSWKTHIRSRVNGHGCPACTGKIVTSTNNLAVSFPEVAKEWDYQKNELVPKKVFKGSEKKVWWECSTCGYGWKTRVSSRTRWPYTNCPACSNKVVTNKNCLKTKYPSISKEWDYVKNDLKPEEVVFGSGKKVWWVCVRCSHKWKTSIERRTGKKMTGCPICSRGPVSKISQRWLDSLGVEEREYYIKDLGYRVDGFNPKTNTVYEFLGDYWHGNPEIYSAEEINPTNKKSYGKLYEETMHRVDKLRDSGYNVVFIWESEYITGVRTDQWV